MPIGFAYSSFTKKMLFNIQIVTLKTISYILFSEWPLFQSEYFICVVGLASHSKFLDLNLYIVLKGSWKHHGNSTNRDFRAFFYTIAKLKSSD